MSISSNSADEAGPMTVVCDFLIRIFINADYCCGFLFWLSCKNLWTEHNVILINLGAHVSTVKQNRPRDLAVAL